MSIIRRFGIGIAAAAGVMLLSALIGGLWYIHAVEPQIAGTVTLGGIAAPIDIVRDRDGIPHIFASTEDDALFAQGFVHAQDRLWQMEMQRRIASGRLAEILGPAAVDIDVLLRTLGIRRAAEAMWARTSAADRVPFEAYARGVNAALASRRSPLPPEFWITGAPAPEPWTPVDSLGWTLMMAFDLGGNWRSELLRLQLVEHGLGVAQIDQLLPPYPGDHYPALGDVPAIYKAMAKDLRTDAGQASQLLAALPGPVEGMGSNNWVVSGARSSTGKPLLANDPHLGLGAPALWYLAHLSAADGRQGGLDVVGASLPGVPGILLGHNRHIAWGFTNTGPDVQDLFIEKINPANPAQYLTPDGWRDLATIEERIHIKGAADRVLTVRTTRHGPIVSDGTGTISRATPPGHALAFAWTALSPDNRTALVANRLARARTWDEFTAALRDFAAPQQTIVYADVDGNIGLIAPGAVPIRKPENDLRGLFPAPGWDARYDWAGFIPFDELPRSFNPAAGFAASANQKIVAPDYPHQIAYEWTAPFRYDRIVELIAATPKHSVQSFAAMQGDIVSLVVRQALPLLLAAPVAGAKEQAAHDLLAAWNATMAAGRSEPLIATAWMRELARLITADALGPTLMRGNFDQRAQFVLDALQNRDGAGQWCGLTPASIGSSPTDAAAGVSASVAASSPTPCAALVTRALTFALADLERRYGSNQSHWTWGTAHNARSAHRPFSPVPVLGRLFDLRIPVGGDTYTLDVGRHNIADPAEPYTAVHGPSLRAIYDLADLENSRFMQSTGQSGIVTSHFYANFQQRWADVRFVTIPTTRSTVDATAMATLHLLP